LVADSGLFALAGGHASRSILRARARKAMTQPGRS
jgi:hypothetical protein